MKTATITLNKDGDVLQKSDYIAFGDWVESNDNVNNLTLKGFLDADNLLGFEENLFRLKLKKLTLEHIDIFSSKEGYFDNNDFVEKILHNVNDNYCQLSILTKILINSDRAKSFVLKDDGFVLSEDRKVLIHIPETVTNCILPEGVEYIGRCTFSGYEELQSVRFNNSLIEIGDYAFINCKNLLEVTLPDSVTTLGISAFDSAGIQELTLSNNIRAIPDGCFLYNDLERLIIPPSVKEIGCEVFRGNWFKEIAIPEDVEKIGYDAFEGLALIVNFRNYP